jgi:predicted amidohydrolase YtcJ
MTTARASTVVTGQVVVAAHPQGVETAEAIGLADGRVVAVGTRGEVTGAAIPGARLVEAGPAAVVPGLCDFHLHLVGMAIARRQVRLDEATSPEQLVAVMREAAARLAPGEWLRGFGWHDAVLRAADADALETAVGRRPALLWSHDKHSAWASAAALAGAGIDERTPDPDGGRIEHDASGHPNGILRERAADAFDRVAAGDDAGGLDEALDQTLAELASYGVTAAVDAGDATADGGSGPYAALGESASILLQSHIPAGRLRLTVNLPAAAIGAAAGLGVRTGDPVDGQGTLNIGWAKAFIDGALGSRTAALFEPYTCGSEPDTGIARLDAGELARIVIAGRLAGISLAIHAIGDRGAATVLDVLEAGPPRQDGAPPDRIEHLQLLRLADAGRLAAADVTASIQPIHCASDRGLVDGCWADRADRAYPWAALRDAGTRFAFGSDAPIELPNPWLGMYAAVHRRLAGDGTPDWHPEHAFTMPAALAGYTSGAAAAGAWPDRGHLRPGAAADLAVLNVPLERLLKGDDDLANVRSVLTLVAGHDVPIG